MEVHSTPRDWRLVLISYCLLLASIGLGCAGAAAWPGPQHLQWSLVGLLLIIEFLRFIGLEGSFSNRYSGGLRFGLFVVYILLSTLNIWLSLLYLETKQNDSTSIGRQYLELQSQVKAKELEVAKRYEDPGDPPVKASKLEKKAWEKASELYRGQKAAENQLAALRDKLAKAEKPPSTVLNSVHLADRAEAAASFFESNSRFAITGVLEFGLILSVLFSYLPTYAKPVQLGLKKCDINALHDHHDVAYTMVAPQQNDDHDHHDARDWLIQYIQLAGGHTTESAAALAIKAKVSVGSLRYAIDSLVVAGTLAKEKRGRRTLIALNRKSPKLRVVA